MTATGCPPRGVRELEYGVLKSLEPGRGVAPPHGMRELKYPKPIGDTARVAPCMGAGVEMKRA